MVSKASPVFPDPDVLPVFSGCPRAQCISFRLVLVGHTDCTTCNFRTTKQILYFFVKGMCALCVFVCVCVCVCADVSVRYDV